MYEKAVVSLPWVSPYKAHQIKKEFKLTKVAAKITKNMVRIFYLLNYMY